MLDVLHFHLVRHASVVQIDRANQNVRPQFAAPLKNDVKPHLRNVVPPLRCAPQRNVAHQKWKVATALRLLKVYFTRKCYILLKKKMLFSRQSVAARDRKNQ